MATATPTIPYRFLLFLMLLFAASRSASAQPHRRSDAPLLKGRVVSADSTGVAYATVGLKGTNIGCATDERGYFRLKVPAGPATLVVSAVGFETREEPIGVGRAHTIVLRPSVTQVEEVVVTGSGVGRVRRSPFNALAVDTKALRNSTKSLAEALAQLPGMKLREAGGVGSDMQLMLDGFSGKHVKVFIDGMPQEGAGTAFDLNNLPAGYAERIEVYKGVVPVGFGTDAIGGVVNVVTARNRRPWFADASYSYGSFNTHKSHVHFGQTHRSGFLYEVNAFQNYSDNDYHVDNWVREFEVRPDGTVHKFPVDKNDVRRVRRFNDRFHNEVAGAKIGLAGKKWADRLVLGFAYTNFYKEIQTGVYQEIVFGQKHRRGHSYAPSLEYRKRDLFVRGLDVAVAVAYNHNITRNIDTAARYYNWYGQYYEKDSRGEQAYQYSLSKNTNWNAALNVDYRLGRIHSFAYSHVFSDFRRTSRSEAGTTSVLTDFDIPKITRKHIGGLSYRLVPSERWNLAAFGKYYVQYNRGPVSQNADGVGNYVNLEKNVGAWGFGAAGTYFILRDLQAKLSYERAFRLPTDDELFGDEDLEAGRADLRPEKSDNLNLNLAYRLARGAHEVAFEGALIYRDTKDYIKRGLGKHGSTQYGIYENHGHVRTEGYNVSVRYAFGRWFTAGGTFNAIDTRDYEKTWTGGSQQQNIHYKVRLPNIPYRYASLDAAFRWHDLFGRGNSLSIAYDGFWQHAFPLYWENIGDKDSKAYVPEQFSHNLTIAYSLGNGRYNLSFECRNLTDARLYDNFSLQKAGRAYYIKVRVHFGK